MIGQITQLEDKNTIVKPLHDSIDPFELWESLYDSGFDNMVVVNAGGYENAVMLYNNIPSLNYNSLEN